MLCADLYTHEFLLLFTVFLDRKEKIVNYVGIYYLMRSAEFFSPYIIDDDLFWNSEVIFLFVSVFQTSGSTEQLSGVLACNKDDVMTNNWLGKTIMYCFFYLLDLYIEIM